MRTIEQVTDAVADGSPFVAILILWTVITAIVYGSFTAMWPDVPDAEPWIFLGVYILPIIGYFGHTLQQALKLSRH